MHMPTTAGVSRIFSQVAQSPTSDLYIKIELRTFRRRALRHSVRLVFARVASHDSWVSHDPRADGRVHFPRHCVDRIEGAWPGFLARRLERLAQRERTGTIAERVTENILEDSFTMVLDWPLADINFQVDYADILLTRLGVKYLIIGAKPCMQPITVSCPTRSPCPLSAPSPAQSASFHHWCWSARSVAPGQHCVRLKLRGPLHDHRPFGRM
jgi:hypothetical protein